MNSEFQTYVAFLRGINVGGHHKVPMATLKSELQKLGLKNIVTLLNSGNIIFEFARENISVLEEQVSTHLEKSFGFSIPTIIRPSEVIVDLLNADPFNNVDNNQNIRLYVSFLKNDVDLEVKLPYAHPDKSYNILIKRGPNIFSVLDMSRCKTPKAMEILENYYGKEITTRNWNTLQRIGKKLLPDH